MSPRIAVYCVYAATSSSADGSWRAAVALQSLRVNAILSSWDGGAYTAAAVAAILVAARVLMPDELDPSPVPPTSLWSVIYTEG